MPPNTRPVETVETPLSERMADEANPPARPDGSPDLWPFLSLPRRGRAEFLRKLAAVQTAMDGLGFTPEDTGGFTLSDGAAVFDLMADVEDLLSLAVAPVDGAAAAFRAWSAAATDTALMELMAWYVAQFQPGEATASPS